MRRWLGLRREDGVAMTEFALVLPVFVAVIAALLGFGRVFFYFIEANHEANEAARWATVDRNPYAASGQSLQQHAIRSSTQEFATSSACIDFPADGTDEVNVGDPVRVRIEKPFSFLSLVFFDVGTVTIRGSATLRIERFADDGSYPPSNYAATDNIGTCGS